MRLSMVLLVALFSCLTAAGQTSAQTSGTASALPPLPKEPAAIFAAAAPLYDYSSEGMKPFHLKASYQLYDEKGQPSAQGTYEYWWVSKGTYRSSWTRPGMEHTDWHVEDKHSVRESGERLEFFERKIQSDLLNPLPRPGDFDPAKVTFEKQEQSFGSAKLPCVMVGQKLKPVPSALQVTPMGMFPTFCFDPGSPTLRVYYAYGAVSVIYNRIARFQGRILPQEFAVLDRAKKMLTVKVESVTDVAANSPDLIPAEGAKERGQVKVVQLVQPIVNGFLIKRVQPVYPEEAKRNRISGKVVLRALIGTDGRIHDLSVIAGPAPSLIAAAMQAVLQWEYRPYLLNGDPVEVDTEINVVFNLGG